MKDKKKKGAQKKPLLNQHQITIERMKCDAFPAFTDTRRMMVDFLQ